MKIAFLLCNMINRAGVERVFAHRMNYLAQHTSHDIYLITYTQGTQALSFALSPKVKHLNLDTGYISFKKTFNPFSVFRFLITKRRCRDKIKNSIEQINPDIITCTDYYDIEIGALIDADIKGKKIIECHQGWHLKKIEINHLSFAKKIREHLRRWMMHRKMCNADLIVCLTPDDSLFWRTSVATHVIPNALSLYPDSEHDYEITHKRIISVGRVVWQKGFDTLADVWQRVRLRYPEWQLDIYGACKDDEWRIKLISSGINLYDNTADIHAVYNSADIYVMPSRYESFGLTLAEAMSAGLACVAFDCPYGPRNIINNGVDGILVADRDSDILTETLCMLIEQPAERKRLGNAARLSTKRFCEEHIMPKWVQLYEAIHKKSKNDLSIISRIRRNIID